MSARSHTLEGCDLVKIGLHCETVVSAPPITLLIAAFSVASSAPLAASFRAS